MRLVLATLAAVVPGLDAAPVPPDRQALADLERAYGTWADPDKDCAFRLKDGALRVTLPGGTHQLGKQYPRPWYNAPRTRRTVSGDFTAVVRVSFPVPGEDDADQWRFCAGGLFAWPSDPERQREYIAVKRVGGYLNGSREGFAAEWRMDDAGATNLKGFDEEAGSGWVRLRREGGKVMPAWSRDGKDWTELPVADVRWESRVTVGVVAESLLGHEVEVAFDRFSLTQPKK